MYVLTSGAQAEPDKQIEQFRHDHRRVAAVTGTGSAPTVSPMRQWNRRVCTGVFNILESGRD